jgi:hypothetical protein
LESEIKELEMKPSIMMKFVIVTMIISMIAIIGCGEDDPVSHDGNGGNGLPPNTPQIPLPSHPLDLLPDRSDSLIMEIAPAITFTPRNEYAPDTIAALVGAPYVYVNTTNNQLSLVYEDQIIDPVNVPFKGCIDPSCTAAYITGSYNCNGIVHVPLLQYTRYWQKIFSTVIQYPSDYMESHTYTEGTSETTGESFSYTLGLSGSAYGIGLSAELTRTFTHSITISSETSVTKQFTCESIEGKTLVFTVWQLVEGFRICNADSSQYTDRTFNHLLIPVIDNATNNLYMSVVQFD